MATTVQIGGLTFQPQGGGGGWFFSSLKDWYSVADSKVEVRSRPQADGAFGIARDWRAAVYPTIEGGYSGVSRVDVLAAKRGLQVLGSGLPQTMTVTDEDGPTSRTVSIRVIDIHDDFGQTIFTFAIDMVATDPSRYGPVVVASTGLPSSGTGLTYPVTYPISYGTPGNSGRLTVSNPGTRESFSLLSVSGGLGGFTVQNVASGQVLRFERDVPLGGTVFLNPRTRRAYLDVPANDVTGFLTVRDWWLVAAGASYELQFNSIGAVTGTPMLSASTKPAY